MNVKKVAANKIKLSDAVVRDLSLPEGKVEMLVWDAGMPKLALRVRSNRRSWVYIYRPPGAGRGVQPQKIGLGAFPGVNVAAARQAAQIEAGRIAKGEDPAETRREERRKDKATLSSILDDYEASLRRRQYKAVSDTMSQLRRGTARIASRDVASLSRKELASIFENLIEAGKPGAAAGLRTHLRTLLEWTTNRGITAHNVLAGMRRERVTRAQRIDKSEKGKALSSDDLAKVWLAASPATVSGRYIRGMILSGSRRGEWAKLDWDHVKADRLVLPPLHTKQGRAHEIPLVPALREIIEACPKMRGSTVFASNRTGGQMSGWTKLVAALVKTSGVKFTLHDLRRTFRSGLTELGVDTETAEMMIAHQREELLAIYDKADRWNLRVKAARKWATHVLGIVAKHELKVSAE